MIDPALTGVFIHAALPQKLVLIALSAAMPLTLISAFLAVRSGVRADLWRRIIGDLRVVGPTLGLFVGGLNSFHMGETIMRLPFDPQLKQLAPGIFEVSTLVSLGALVGLIAAVAHVAVGFVHHRRHA